MGQQQSSESRDYRVMLDPATSHDVHTEIMENYVKARGGSVGFIYWPKPLGFTCTLPEHHLGALQALPEVLSIAIDDGDSVDPDPEPEDDSMWTWVCGSSRPRNAAELTLQPMTHRMPVATNRTAHYLVERESGMPGRAPTSLDGIVAKVGSSTGSMSYAHEAWMPAADDPMMDDLIERERQGVRSMLMQLSPLKLDADTATRFLRAKVGDPAAAAGMFRKHLEWRTEEGVDSLWKEPPLPPLKEALLSKVFSPRLLDGRDKLGRPVLFVDPTDLNLEALASHGVTEKLLLRRYVRAMERVVNALDHSAHPLGGHLALYDVRNMTTLATFRTMNLWIRIGRTLESNYPETLGTLVVVGMPSGADWIFDHVKGLMNEKTAAKIRLHAGSDPKAIRAALALYLPPETLFRASSEIHMLGPTKESAGDADADAEDAAADDADGVSTADIIESGRSMLPRAC